VFLAIFLRRTKADTATAIKIAATIPVTQKMVSFRFDFSKVGFAVADGEED